MFTKSDHSLHTSALPDSAASRTAARISLVATRHTATANGLNRRETSKRSLPLPDFQAFPFFPLCLLPARCSGGLNHQSHSEPLPVRTRIAFFHRLIRACFSRIVCGHQQCCQPGDPPPLLDLIWALTSGDHKAFRIWQSQPGQCHALAVF